MWVNDDIARAIRTESAEALTYWFGVSTHAVWNWRRAFGVEGQAGTPGSKAAHLEHSWPGRRRRGRTGSHARSGSG